MDDLQVGWMVVLAAVLAGFAVRAGAEHGAQLLAPLLDRRLARGRADCLSHLRSRILRSEVGLVLAAAVVGGAFPGLARRLLGGFTPLVIAFALAAASASTALRLHALGVARRSLASVACVAAVIQLGIIGLIGTIMAIGVPLRDPPRGYVSWVLVSQPLVALVAATCVIAGAAHGAVDLAARRVGSLAARARRAAVGLLAATVVLVVASTVAAMRPGVLSALVNRAVLVAGAAIIVVALAVALAAVASGRLSVAVGATSVALAAPVLTLGVAQAPNLLVSHEPARALSIASVSARPAILAVMTAAAIAAAASVLISRARRRLPRSFRAVRRSISRTHQRVVERRRAGRIDALVLDAVSVAERAAQLDEASRKLISERVQRHLERRRASHGG